MFHEISIFNFSLLLPTILFLGISDARAEKMVKDPQAKIVSEKATFGGGCFWCMEAPFEKVEGVISVVSGYSGGHLENPTYEQVTSGKTGHAEVIQVSWDPTKTNYKKMLELFWRNINPTTLNQQFVDTGTQYRTAIFYHNEEQKRQAEQSKIELTSSGRFKESIVTEITPFEKFYPAEDYHQDYYKKNPIRYKFYSTSSGRPGYLKKIWKD